MSRLLTVACFALQVACIESLCRVAVSSRCVVTRDGVSVQWFSRNTVNEQTVDCCVFCLAGSLYRVSVSRRCIESLCRVAVS